MKRLLSLLVAAFLWTSPADAAIAAVTTQVTDCSGNDCVLTFAGNWTENNVVVVGVRVNNTTNTVDLTDISETESILHGPSDSTPGNRFYLFCFVVDGTADLNVTVTTSGSASVTTLGAEFSGATCTEDGTSSGNDDSASAYELTSDVTTSVCGSMVIGLIGSSTTSNFSKNANYTALGDGGHASEADYNGGDDTGNSLMQYLVTVATGTHDPTFTSAASEDAFIIGAAIQPTSACAAATGYINLLLVGVG